MKKFVTLILSTVLALSLAACGNGVQPLSSPAPSSSPTPRAEISTVEIPQGTAIALSDSGITVDGQPVSQDSSAPVYTAHDIVFYLEGQGFTYGEGTVEDEHSQAEADTHTVVHITEPGTYVISGSLSAGQIAVDLGEGAEDDPNAVVNLVLNNAEISCSVAPAIIFYQVYECDSKDNPQADVDTTAAGANVYLANGSKNTVRGSYVARIYKSYELNEEGTEVVTSKKLHKYDGALYSKMSMNVTGNDGILNIEAENEGLDTELHLTINGGVIRIVSGNDGINTNEDGVSVTTVNGGQLTITVDGSTGEGDGIDSNGWLVINGGVVQAYACSFSGDSGIDSDMGIILNGGQVAATGNMLDAIDNSSGQSYVVFDLRGTGEGVKYALKDTNGSTLMEIPTANNFSILLASCPELSEGSGYELYDGDSAVASAHAGASGMGGPGFPGGQAPMPNGEMPPDPPGEETPPEPPEGQAPPVGPVPSGIPEGQQRPGGGGPGNPQQPPAVSEKPAEENANE